MLHEVILAANGADFFTATELGKAIASVMKAMALLVVLIAAAKGVKDVMAGKGGKAAQMVIGAAVVVTFLWEPTLIGKLIGLAADLVGMGADGVEDVTGATSTR